MYRVLQEDGATRERRDQLIHPQASETGIGSTVGLGHAKIGQQQGHRFGPHDRSTVCMKTELAGLDVLLFAGSFDELLGQLGAFARGHHPADDVTAEHVEDDVEVKK